jgi:hypothetical protein
MTISTKTNETSLVYENLLIFTTDTDFQKLLPSDEYNELCVFVRYYLKLICPSITKSRHCLVNSLHDIKDGGGGSVRSEIDPSLKSILFLPEKLLFV